MSSSYRDARRDVAIADDYLATHLACSICRSMAPHADLASYGARCEACYRAYCAELNPSWMPNRPLTRDERLSLAQRAQKRLQAISAIPHDPRGWARRLKGREEEAGEALTAFQRDAWRSVLRREPEAGADDSVLPPGMR